MNEIELPMGDECKVCEGFGQLYDPLLRVNNTCMCCGGTGLIEFEEIELESIKGIDIKD